MPATITLATTTLAQPVGQSDATIKLASTSGLIPGTRLYVDRELMSVVSLGPSPWVNVRRGQDGTLATPHSSSVDIWIGAADQFYSYDPQGAPLEAVLTSPHINVLTGDKFFAQGDGMPIGQTRRWWQKQTTSYDQGSLGVRTITSSPTSST